MHMHDLALSRPGAAKLETGRKIFLKNAHDGTFDHAPFPAMACVTERIDGFRGNEQAYVTYLEGEVGRLRRQQQLGVLDHGRVTQNEGLLQLSSARDLMRCPDSLTIWNSGNGNLQRKDRKRPARRGNVMQKGW
jgi:hypothetical protein